MSNKNFIVAKEAADDEHYTKYKDVENELKYYWSYLKDKVIYCPCDDDKSAFVKYLKNNKNNIGYKKLYYTSIKNGFDFRDQDNSFADIIITNPPFSLFTKFMKWCENKDFIVLGPFNCLAYPYIFDQITNQKMFFGHNVHKTLSFDRPDGSEKEVGCTWFTSLGKPYDNHLQLKTKAENEKNGVEYKIFDNKNIINVPRVNQIPSDYKEQMGVPITFLEKWNPDDYEILGRRYGDDGKDLKINGKLIYVRAFIRRR